MKNNETPGVSFKECLKLSLKIVDLEIPKSVRSTCDSTLREKVQRQIMETCKEKFPEYAGQAKTCLR